MTGLKSHEEVFFSLLRSAMWGTPSCVPHDFKEWGQLIKLAKVQSVLGVVSDVMLSDEDISSRFSEKAEEKLKSFIMANMMTSERLDKLLAASVGLLREAGIRPVLLKGQGLAAYYPAPHLRQCGDIDLYVGPEDYRKAYDVMETIASGMDDIRKLDIGIHFDVHVGNLDVEIHRFTEVYPTRRLDRIYQAASDKGMTEGLVPVRIADMQVDTPSDVFNAFYVFGHMFRHFLYEGVGFRQLCDWMMLLHARKDHIDTEALRKLVESMGMMKPWQTFGCVLVEVMGLPADEFPLYDSRYNGLVGKVISRILEEGNFGKRRAIFRNKGESYLLNKARSFFSHFIRVYELFSVFPAHAFRQLWHTLGDAFVRVWTDVRIRFEKPSPKS